MRACVCACVRVCVRACVRVRAHVCHNEKKCQTNGKHDKPRIPAILQVSSMQQAHRKENYNKLRGPFHQSITAILTEEKREEKQFTKPTHVAVHLFRDLDVCACVRVCVLMGHYCPLGRRPRGSTGD